MTLPPCTCSCAELTLCRVHSKSSFVLIKSGRNSDLLTIAGYHFFVLL